MPSDEIEITVAPSRNSTPEPICKLADPDFLFPEAVHKEKRTFVPKHGGAFRFPDPIDNKVVRLTSFQIFLVAVFLNIIVHYYNFDTFWWFLIPVCGFDFLMRTLFGPCPFSPFGMIATSLLCLFNVTPNYVPSSAKRFSFFLGVVLCTVLSTFNYILDTDLKKGPLLVLAVFSGLESIGGFCVGCWFYGTFFKLRDRWYTRKDYLALAPSKSVAQKRSNPLVDNAEPEEHSFKYDLIVIGGGSGGLSAAKEAARLGKKVCILDFVKPSNTGRTWRVGGTCVNVGCIPKFLYHTSALNGEGLHDLNSYGWNIGGNKIVPGENINFDWNVLRNNIAKHIENINKGYETALPNAKVEYINAFGEFVSPHEVKITNPCGESQIITGRRIVIAVGGRPMFPDIPGVEEHSISSDDIFALEKAPGKTLIVGASYIALETAGFLRGLGYDVTVMVRSVTLRGFDRAMADMIVENLKIDGIKFLEKCSPLKIEGKDDQKLVTYKSNTGELSEAFDTVMFATGRVPVTKALNLEKAGVAVNEKGKIPCYRERTTTPHIYCIGDAMENGLELTPVASQSGLLLAKRLYDGSDVLMDYNMVATTVFTPIEYGSIGFSEEKAIEVFGDDNIEVFHSYFTPLTHFLPNRQHKCYAKIIVNFRDKQRVIGLHYLGPNAGEVTQGFATGIKAGLTKPEWDSVVGIHPSCAEELVTLRKSKKSGLDAKKTSC